MIPILMAIALLSALAAGLYVGVRLARILRDQFDEMMPQRMVDYSGFIETGSTKD